MQDRDLEELLKEIESTEKLDITAEFLKAFKITQGNKRIPKKSLNRLFKAWAIPGSKNKLSLYLSEKRNDYMVSGNTIDLINRILNAIEQKEYKFKTNYDVKKVYAFRQKYNLHKGNVWLSQDILYYFYYSTCTENKKTLLNRKNFFNICNMYFDTRDIYLKVNQEFITMYITQDVLDKTKEWLRTTRENKKSSSKNKSSQRRKISSAK